MKNNNIEVQPVSNSVGAQIRGVDLAEPLTEFAYRKIRKALCEWGVLFFCEQNLTPDQHLTFGKRFGGLHVSKTIGKVPGHPLVAEVRKEPNQKRNIGGNWHTDHSFAENPPLGSILVARELPDTGGDTLFANMSSAYENLSKGMKITLQGLSAVHAKKKALQSTNLSTDRRVSKKELEQMGDAVEEQYVHPVVAKHPETGRKILYLNPTYSVRFDGWTEQESKPLLQFLFEQACSPENTCRFHWNEGSVVFWDNRTVWHYAINDYHGKRRVLHRVSVEGSKISAT
ncbi:MAG: TauD/TfdA dioxygenase family protein [Alphaproteobacteria bacterium]